MNSDLETAKICAAWISGVILGYAFAALILGSYLYALETRRRFATYSPRYNREAAKPVE